MFNFFKGDGRLSKRVTGLEEELATLKREHKEAVLEAGQLYEQTRRILGRLSKRAPEPAHVPDDAPDAPPGPDSAPRVHGPDPVSARILSLRRGKRAFPGSV